MSSACKSYTEATTIEKVGTGAKMSANRLSVETKGRLLSVSNVQALAL